MVLLIGIAGGLGLAFLFARSIVKSMRGAVSTATEIASGKLDGQINVQGQDEVGELMRSMHRMQRDLKERIERDQKIADENLRIRTALDKSSTSTFHHQRRSGHDLRQRGVHEAGHALRRQHSSVLARF